ncbi:glycosyltransferase family 2 protein [Solirubrobacter ginsenosidimutans]|uniref:Glycosyltransferase family 2 protein n=1 Tax=Solirubrobacter ginsenosidimutans TaxID=490573 RepID=A0A9X3N283_9ACTN|nr:glycosyltransferase family A protein [Solirubrobacter ginsenosidimutans]MDA0166932.1 glycosyltransferase family 2 protein [Solirubrobacter ginsenosidimutans]
MQPRILIISPVRNEAAHIERVIRAMAAQQLPPTRWIIIDDKSTDDTLAILKRLEPEVPFLQVAQVSDAPEGPVRDRLARAAAPRTFNAGLAVAGDISGYTHVMKLDGDIELRPDYFTELMARFDADPTVGLAGGVLDEPTPEGGMRRIKIAGNHVHGALKCYSMACFEAIGGVQERLGWDTIDETYARMRGFGTVHYSELVGIHHRPIGSADGTLRGHARHGECAYIAHHTFWWISLRAFRVGRRKPRVISGLAFIYGFIRAAARRVERVPDLEYRRFARRELRQRAVGALVPHHGGVR